MTHTRTNEKVCSTSTTVQLEQGIIQNIRVEDGCDGNLKAVCALLRGRAATEAISILQGITCEDKSTSCAGQIALCLKEAIALEQ